MLSFFCCVYCMIMIKIFLPVITCLKYNLNVGRNSTFWIFELKANA